MVQIAVENRLRKNMLSTWKWSEKKLDQRAKRVKMILDQRAKRVKMI